MADTYEEDARRAPQVGQRPPLAPLVASRPEKQTFGSFYQNNKILVIVVIIIIIALIWYFCFRKKNSTVTADVNLAPKSNLFTRQR